MIGVDTNVLVRLLVDDDADQRGAALGCLERRSAANPAFAPMIVMAELWWVLTGHYGFDRAETCDALDWLVRLDLMEFEDGETVVQALDLARRGADFADALIADTGRVFGCETTVTLDRRASQLAGMTLLS